MKATEAELGWLAGMLEGEGCITFFKQNQKNKKFNIVTGIQITNTDLGIINKLIEILEKCGLSWFVRTKKVYKNTHNECYYIETRQQDMIRKSLKLLIPYMYGQKKDKANLVLKFLNKRFETTNGKIRGNYPYTEDELSFILRDYTRNSISGDDIVQTV